MKFLRLVRALKGYLYDDRTGRAWVVGAFSVLLLLQIQNDNIDAVLLAFLGVTITFIVLPDPKRDVEDALRQNNVWLSEPEQLAAAFPPEVLRQTAQAVYTASLPPTPTGLEAYLDPRLPVGAASAELVRLWTDPSALVLNMRYDLDLQYKPPETVSMPLYATRSTTISERWMNVADQPPYAAFCRTTEAFGREFNQMNCLTRELIEVSPDVWAELMAESSDHFAATIVVRAEDDTGHKIEARLDCPHFEASDDILRVRFPLPDELARVPAGRVWCYEEYLHPLPASIRCFPAIFSSYFTAGSTHVSLTLDDPRARKMTAMSYMSDVRGYQLSADRDVLPMSASSRSLRAALSFHDQLFWPGSGAVFYWECD